MPRLGGETKGVTLPPWVVELGLKVLPYILIAIIGAGAKLYIDNIAQEKDIARNTWRNDEDSKRFGHLEDRVTKNEDTVSTMKDNQDRDNQEIIRHLKHLVGNKDTNRR